MGTAPGQRQQPTMPDPDRVVSRSLVVLEHHGYDRQPALGMIAFAAETAAMVLRHGGVGDTWWLDGIKDSARSRMRPPGGKQSDRTEQ